MSAAIEARGVEKRYGSLVAVADLSFAVEAGEILGVIGPNGAGKRILLLALGLPGLLGLTALGVRFRRAR